MWEIVKKIKLKPSLSGNSADVANRKKVNLLTSNA